MTNIADNTTYPFGSFLKMISVAATGGTITNFSPRFSLSGMTGAFPPNVVSGLAKVTSTDGPATVNQVAGKNAAGGGGAGVNAAGGDPVFDVPYLMQEGLTKYAPMLPVPPTKISLKSAPPLNPTSDVPMAKDWLPKATIATTVTQSPTFSVESRENTVCYFLICCCVLVISSLKLCVLTIG